MLGHVVVPPLASFVMFGGLAKSCPVGIFATLHTYFPMALLGFLVANGQGTLLQPIRCSYDKQHCQHAAFVQEPHFGSASNKVNTVYSSCPQRIKFTHEASLVSLPDIYMNVLTDCHEHHDADENDEYR